MTGVEKEQREPLFTMGDIVATPGALKALEAAGQHPRELLRRHVTGDWGINRAVNELGLERGYGILSPYQLNTGETVWVMTEADRSATTILLPDEY